MKYEKEAVVERVEKALERIREREEGTFQTQRRDYLQAVEARNKHREKLFKLVNSLKKVSLRESVEDDALVEKICAKFAEVGQLNHGFSTRRGDEYIGQVLSGATYVLTPPVKNTTRSEDLESALNVFKTGAPPQVSVNDLRAFGLMNFVKFGG